MFEFITEFWPYIIGGIILGTIPTSAAQANEKLKKDATTNLFNKLNTPAKGKSDDN